MRELPIPILLLLVVVVRVVECQMHYELELEKKEYFDFSKDVQYYNNITNSMYFTFNMPSNIESKCCDIIYDSNE